MYLRRGLLGVYLESIIGVSRVHNNQSKRRKRSNSKCGLHWRMFLKDNGKFRSVRISASKAAYLKMRMSIFNITTVKSDEIRLIRCDKCHFIQKDIGQKVCENCSY